MNKGENGMAKKIIQVDEKVPGSLLFPLSDRKSTRLNSSHLA